MLRVIDELRPEIVFVENVAALRNRGLIDVLRGLDGIGYLGEWRTLSAQEVGALHQRKRLWIIATPKTALRDADSDECGTPLHLFAGTGDLGDGGQPSRSDVGLTTRADWKAIEAEGSFHGKPLACGKHDGIPHLLDRIVSLGNAIVPQCAAKVLKAVLLNRPSE
jgi:site-specific DNA-cytosine methylase